MPHKDPAFLLYYESYLNGTKFMSDAAKGVYIDLLCNQADLGPLSWEQMKTLCPGIDLVWNELQNKFQQSKTGTYYNKRLNEELEKRMTYCKSRSHKKMEEQHPSPVRDPYGVPYGNRTKDKDKDQNQDQNPEKVSNKEGIPLPY